MPRGTFWTLSWDSRPRKVEFNPGSGSDLQGKRVQGIYGGCEACERLTLSSGRRKPGGVSSETMDTPHWEGANSKVRRKKEGLLTAAAKGEGIRKRTLGC